MTAPVLDKTKSPSAGIQTLNAPAPTNGSTAGSFPVSQLVDFSSVGGVEQLGGLDNVSDVDADVLLGIAVTAVGSATGYGTWYYSIDAGATWATVGTVNATTNSLPLRSTDLLYFKPITGYAFYGPSALTFKAWDQSVGTAGTKANNSAAYSTDTDTVDITIPLVFSDTPAFDTASPFTSAFISGDVNYDVAYNPVVNNEPATWTTLSEPYAYNSVNYTLSLTGKYGTLYSTQGFYGGGSGIPPTAANYVYVPNDSSINALSTTNTDVFSVTSRSMMMGGSSNINTLTVIVNGTNDAPIITSNGGGNTAAISIAENTTAVTTVTSTDAENDAVTYSISGDDSAKFSVDSVSGALAFVSAPDFETPTDTGGDNVYNVIVTATDSGNLTDSQSIAITVTNVVEDGETPPATTPEPTPVTNTAPVLSSSAVTINYTDTAINDTFAASSGTFTATDADSDTLTFGIIEGGTVANGISSVTNAYGTLAVTAATGAYTFTPNTTAINALTANATATFSIVANDGKDNSTPQTFTVNLTGANDQPVLNSGGTVAGTYNAAVPTGLVGTLVSSLVSSSNVTDSDSGAIYGLAITATDSNGSWFYSTNAGTDWTAVGAVSATSALLLAADANTRIYFQPNNGFVGAANLTMKAWDTTFGIAGNKVDASTDTAFSSATDTVVVNVNKLPIVDVNFNSSTTIATAVPTAVYSASSVNLRTGTDQVNTFNASNPNQRFGLDATHPNYFLPATTANNFLVLGDDSGQLAGSPSAGTFGFAVPFSLAANTSSIQVSFDWIFSGFVLGTAVYDTDQFKVGIKGAGFDIAAPLTVTATVLDQSITPPTTGSPIKLYGSTTTPVTLNMSDLGAADSNGKYWLSFGLFEAASGYLNSGVGIDNIKITAIEEEVINGTSPVTLTSFSAITGSNEDSEQTITFADLIAAGDEASTAGEVNAFVIKAVSTGTLKIGATAETATTWEKDTNDVVDASHNVYWTPAADASGTLNAFTAIAKESGGQTSLSSKLVTVSVTAINDAPVLNVAKSPAFTGDYSGNAPSGAVGALVSSLVDFATPAGQVDNITEVDTGAALGIAITATDNTNGVWHYSTDAGSTWTAVGEVSTTSALLLAADANTRVYFQATNGFVGVSNFTIKAWDQTTGTVGTKMDTSTDSAFSIATDNVEVKPAGNYAVYNDTAAVDTFSPSLGSFQEGRLNSSLSSYVDPTVNGVAVTTWNRGTNMGTAATIDPIIYIHEGIGYALSLVGEYGTLYSQSGVDTNSSARVPFVYIPNNSKINALPADESKIDAFRVTGVHRPMAFGTPYPDSLNIYVKGANDAPALTGEKAILLSNSITAAELLQGYSDVDNGDELSIADLTVNSGSLANNNNGTWTFTPVTGFSGEITLSYDVVDKLGAKVAATQTLSALPEAISLHSNLQSTLSQAV